MEAAQAAVAVVAARVARGQPAYESTMGEMTEAVTEDRKLYVGSGQWESSRNCKD